MVAFRTDDRGEPLFRELDHTADLGIEVEAASPEDLFRRTGLALYALMVTPSGIEARQERRVTVAATGWVELLHDWLSLLLSSFLGSGFVASRILVDGISETGIDSRLIGENLDWERHEFLSEIKAVTYHELRVERTDEGWRARVIFDV